MPIVGVTHNPVGTVKVSRSVTAKVAIGLPPGVGGNYPKKLDHMVFQRKASKSVEVKDDRGNKRTRTEVAWVIDEEKQNHYGADCKEVWIVLLDDDPDVTFRTELAWWTKTERRCHGDGENGYLKRPDQPDLERPCANNGCPDWESGACKPSGDLNFLLADFPTLGTVCKLHTTSFQSIREIRSALEDLRMVTGGRLMGVRVKLTVRSEKNSFKGPDGKMQTGTKFILGLELTAKDIAQLTGSLAESVLMFDSVRKRIGAHSVEILEDPDTDIAPAIAAEFYPVDQIRPAQAEVFQPSTKVATGVVLPPEKSGPKVAQAAKASPVITDEDLPSELFGDEVDPAQTIAKGDAFKFYQRWERSGKKEPEVSRYLREVIKVDSSLKIPQDRFAEAMNWAASQLNPIIPPEASPAELMAREFMDALGLDLIRRGNLVNECGGDWDAVLAQLHKIADEENS